MSNNRINRKNNALRLLAASGGLTLGMFGGLVPANAGTQIQPPAVCAIGADGSSISVPGAVVAEGIRSALPEPAKLSWGEFHPQSYTVTAGDLIAAGNVLPDGTIQLSLTSAGGIRVQVNATAIDNKPIQVAASTAGFKATINLTNREGLIDLPMTLSVDNPKNQTSVVSEIRNFAKVGFRAWVIPETGAADFTLRVKVSYEQDGTVSLTPIGYDAPMDSCLKLRIPVRHLGVLHGVLPLNPNRPLEIKFKAAGHMFVIRKSNPLRDAIGQVINTRHVVAHLPPPPN